MPCAQTQDHGGGASHPSRRARSPGFTMFEVLAAVLVLGILYTVLATSAIEGLRAEGESKRRLQASLLADEHLIGLESELAAGLFPEIGIEETEIEQFQLVIEVAPFDVTPYLGDAFQEELSEGRASLLSPDRTEGSLLRLVSVMVRWFEAADEHEVRRSTIAYDQATIASLVPSSGAAPDGSEFLNSDGSPNIQAMMDKIQQITEERQ